MGASLGIVLAVLLISACSRQEKPAVPSATKGKGVEKAPAVDQHERPIAFTNKVPDAALSGHKGSAKHVFTEKEQKASTAAMQQRRKAYAEKVMGERLRTMEKEIEELTGRMQAIEAGAVSNEAVRAACETLSARRKDYDGERIKLPGMEDLWKKREAAKLRLAELRSRDAAGEQGNALVAAQDELLKLTRKMYEAEMAGRSNSTTLSQSVQALRESEAGYQTSLMAIPEFKILAGKQQELLVAYQKMLERQKTYGQEEK